MTLSAYKTHFPDLLEIQKSSFFWFLTEGLAEELGRFPSVFQLPNKVELRIYSQEYSLRKPIFSELDSQKRDRTYGVKLYIPVKISVESEIDWDDPSKICPEAGIDLFTKEKIFLGEIPLMTNNATFIYNGYKRIILHQIVRSPGLYFKVDTKAGSTTTANKDSHTYIATILPYFGSWLSFELEEVFEINESFELQEKNLLWVRIDKVYKIPIHWFITALKLTKTELSGNLKNFKHLKRMLSTIKEELQEIRDNNLDKLNKSSSFKKRKLNFERDQATSEDIAILEVQELIFSKVLTSKNYDLSKIGRRRLNKRLSLNIPLDIRVLTSSDLLKIIDQLIDLKLSRSKIDDIDSLENRRVRCVGELLQLQFRSSLNRIEKTIEKKVRRDEVSLNPQNWITAKPLTTIMREFFGSSQLSQFMDEVNPLSEMTHKRRVSSLGPGGLSSDHVSFDARDIHPTQYGRLCPIETSEGENAGLVSSLATYSKINLEGFLQTPFFSVEKGEVIFTEKPIYLTAEEESEFKIAAADTKVNSKNFLQGELIPVRYMHEFTLAPAHEVNFISISSIQILSAAASLIPFLEHDDANRALMGSNMQRQAVPLLRPQQPIVGTGLEMQIAGDSRICLVNKQKGRVIYVSASIIKVYDGTKVEVYHLQKYMRTNQDTCINQKPIVWLGEYVQSGQILADGAAMVQGELALGQNLTVAYMPWEGYNYEDAVLVSERLVYDDLFTSIHIERYEIEIEENRTGPEEITPIIPEVSHYLTRNLDSEGLVYIGALVEAHDILVGKVAPKEDLSETPEVRLLNAIFGTKTPVVFDTSLKVPLGVRGRVIDISYSSGEKNLLPGTTISIFIAQVCKIQVGDKIAGRHGNKGVISRILPYQDMPYLPDGTVVDIILNPLGVPSRMNVGQIFESLLGLAGDQLQERFKILPFDEKYGLQASRILITKKLKQASEVTEKSWLFNPDCLGKVHLTDGRTGEAFDNPVLIGKAYIIKLIHLVDDKIHARSTGPYSLVTQQPLGGKSHHGGQRFGEMEVWALEAYGAAYNLQELLTIKSDDMYGRNEMFSALVRRKVLPKPGVPESFNVLLGELKALGIDIKAYKFKKLATGFGQSVEINPMTTRKILSKYEERAQEEKREKKQKEQQKERIKKLSNKKTSLKKKSR